MKRANPFPSVSILLPDDIVEDNDATVASFWRNGDSCLLQISCFRRERGPQVSAAQRLSERTGLTGEWQTFNLPTGIKACDVAAASTTDDLGTSWVHIYFVWEWLTIHASVSKEGDLSMCDWAWNALGSLQPIVM